MTLIPELKKLMTERYVDWAESWGMSFVFAVTQSVDKSESVMADSISALIASDAAAEASRREQGQSDKAAVESGKQQSLKLPSSITAVRFAAVLWQLSSKQAFRGFGTDAFFRMPAVSRAIVALKVRGRFSRQQIAAALHLPLKQVDDHLENSRLLFSDGRSWTESGPEVLVHGDRWTAECPQWAASVPRSDASATGQPHMQDLFAQYVGNDLDHEEGSKLHSHLIACSSCRTGFSHFKKNYVDWAKSIPAIEPDHQAKKHLKYVTKLALKVNRQAPPSPWPGLKRVLTDAQARALLLGALSILLVQYLLAHRGHQ